MFVRLLANQEKKPVKTELQKHLLKPVVKSFIIMSFEEAPSNKSCTKGRDLAFQAFPHTFTVLQGDNRFMSL